MGKKGSWFSVIKRVFTPSSKDKLAEELEKKNTKEKKKKGLGKLKHGESFIPLFREPSSIEKILGEAEQQYHPIDFRPLGTFEQPSSPSIVPFRAATPLQDDTPQRTLTPPVVASPPRISSSRSLASPTMATTPQRVVSSSKGSTSQRIVSSPKSVTPPKNATPERTVSPPRTASPRKVVSSSQAATPSTAATLPRSASPRFVHRQRPEPTVRYQHVCATKIQAAYRGYKARKSFRALRGLVRLQTVVKGQSSKRQTVNAMKSMQLLTRVQTQIQSRRIQMLENRALQLQALESQKASENGNPDGWDDSRLTKDEVDARTQKKSEAIIKRERAMAYAYSRQPWKKTPQAALMDIHSSGGFPWWWSWLDRQTNPTTAPTKPSESPSFKSRHLTPPWATTTASLLIADSSSLGFDNSASGTPRSTRSAAVPARMRLTSLTPPSRLLGNNKFPRSRPAGANSSLFNDDDSLMSCPTFSGPRFMEPTASTFAKKKGGFGVSPDVQSKRRVSFPFAQGVGSFKWNRRGSTSSGVGSFKWNRRGSTSSANTTPGRDGGGGPRKGLERKQSMQSIGSVDSTVSMPAALGRKPFNRFV